MCSETGVTETAVLGSEPGPLTPSHARHLRTQVVIAVNNEQAGGLQIYITSASASARVGGSCSEAGVGLGWGLDHGGAWLQMGGG